MNGNEATAMFHQMLDKLLEAEETFDRCPFCNAAWMNEDDAIPHKTDCIFWMAMSLKEFVEGEGE